MHLLVPNAAFLRSQGKPNAITGKASTSNEYLRKSPSSIELALYGLFSAAGAEKDPLAHVFRRVSSEASEEHSLLQQGAAARLGTSPRVPWIQKPSQVDPNNGKWALKGEAGSRPPPSYNIQ